MVKDCAPLFEGADDEPPSCINLSCVLKPQSGAVRTLFLVNSPLVSTMPSPVPMSWSKKSLNGCIILLPKAAGTTKVPPLMTEPTGAVVIERTWQTEQLSESKRAEPGSVASFIAIERLRGGALVERM